MGFLAGLQKTSRDREPGLSPGRNLRSCLVREFRKTAQALVLGGIERLESRGLPHRVPGADAAQRHFEMLLRRGFTGFLCDQAKRAESPVQRQTIIRALIKLYTQESAYELFRPSSPMVQDIYSEDNPQPVQSDFHIIEIKEWREDNYTTKEKDYGWSFDPQKVRGKHIWDSIDRASGFIYGDPQGCLTARLAESARNCMLIGPTPHPIRLIEILQYFPNISAFYLVDIEERALFGMEKYLKIEPYSTIFDKVPIYGYKYPFQRLPGYLNGTMDIIWDRWVFGFPFVNDNYEICNDTDRAKAMKFNELLSSGGVHLSVGGEPGQGLKVIYERYPTVGDTPSIVSIKE